MRKLMLMVFVMLLAGCGAKNPVALPEHSPSPPIHNRFTAAIEVQFSYYYCYGTPWSVNAGDTTTTLPETAPTVTFTVPGYGYLNNGFEDKMVSYTTIAGDSVMVTIIGWNTQYTDPFDATFAPLRGPWTYRRLYAWDEVPDTIYISESEPSTQRPLDGPQVITILAMRGRQWVPSPQ